ncbi:MAG: HD-GYP domain-containing protein [Thermodesulfobacteriota bacterium]
MIKKVPIEKLRPGIFVHDFNCGFNSSYLLANQALIKDIKIIDHLRSFGIREVYIDTDKGHDVSDARPEIEIRRGTDNGLRQLAREEPISIRNVPLKEELIVARNIKKQAVNVIRNAVDCIRSGKPLETEEAYDLIGKMEKSVTRNPDALVLLTRIRKKDEYTLMHSISVGAYVLNFCNFYKVPHQQTLSLAIGALFHDIGKTKIPRTILNKPGKLDEQEFAEMKRHTFYSAEVLQTAKGLPEEAYDMGLHHHERYDGSGYPHRLRGEDIKTGSQLCAIADVYDAITSDRCYRNGMGRVEGLRKLYEWSESHFNKDLTHKFIRSIGVYPIGSCVRLQSGRIGVVIGSTENLVQPVVRLFHDDERKKPLPLQDIDLSLTDDQVVGYEDADKWQIGTLNLFEKSISDLLAL